MNMKEGTWFSPFLITCSSIDFHSVAVKCAWGSLVGFPTVDREILKKVLDSNMMFP